jgi:glycosyltransferase involved in cell wall biosynthesis
MEYPRLKKEPYVLAVGRAWDAAKNLETLAQVAPSLPWPVYLAGERQHPDGGRTELRHVKILGQLAPEILANWYARASIYALPARYEPFGLSVLEASLAGCAPVIGDIESLRELWDEGAACFIPADDPQALQDAINTLIDNPDWRGTIAGLAAARARRYTLEGMAENYLSLYQNLLEGRGSSDARVPATLA